MLERRFGYTVYLSSLNEACVTMSYNKAIDPSLSQLSPLLFPVIKLSASLTLMKRKSHVEDG